MLEVEQRWNLDLIWGLIDSLLGGPLGYEQSVSEAWSDIVDVSSQGIIVEYPFTRLNGTTEGLPIHCFTLKELRDACDTAGLRIQRVYGVHSISNLLPSTVLGNPHLPHFMRTLARFLVKIDGWVKGIFPFNRLGCSSIIIAQKRAIS
jgi:MPBQ/MSBQ methyltransferase